MIRRLILGIFIVLFSLWAASQKIVKSIPSLINVTEWWQLLSLSLLLFEELGGLPLIKLFLCKAYFHLSSGKSNLNPQTGKSDEVGVEQRVDTAFYISMENA